MNPAHLVVLLKKNSWVVNMLFVALGSYFVGGAANAVVARHIRVVPTFADVPPPPQRKSPQSEAEGSEYAFMAQRNLMGAQRENLNPVPVDLEGGEEVAPDDAAALGRAFDENDLRPCTVPMTLRGTLVSDSPEWSMAVVYHNSKREVGVYTINDGSNAIGEDLESVIVDIRNREIIVRRRDHFERCSSEKEVKGKKPSRPRPTSRPSTQNAGAGDGFAKVSETEYNVERAEVDKALSNLSEVATQARIVPSFKNGKANGFKLFSIKPGSIYSKLGLQNGDVIQKINGYEMNSPDKALEIYQKLKDANSVAIDLQRRGRSMSFSYNIGEF